MLELTVRLIASLAVVVGLLLLLARLAGRRFAGREGAPVQVLHRQPLSRTSSIAVVSVGSRLLVVGATEQQVRLLTELDPDELGTDLVLLEGSADEPSDLPTPLSSGAVEDALAARTRLAGPRTSGGRAAGAHRAAPDARSAQGPLNGSVLSPQTWRQAFAAATGKAS
jgi:flagellar protein FliO/FliZ